MSLLRSLQRSNAQPLLQAASRKVVPSSRSLITSATRSANPNSPTSQAISEVSKQEGGTHKGSKAAQLQSELTKQRNSSASASASTSTPDSSSSKNDAPSPSPQTQSELDRKANHAATAEEVESKLSGDPSSITKEDGDAMHSREVRAFGASEKGGLASRAQKQAAVNEGETKGE